MKKLKLKQVNKDFKCPECKKFSLVESRGSEWISEDTMMMWEFFCRNCNAKFTRDKNDDNIERRNSEK